MENDGGLEALREEVKRVTRQIIKLVNERLSLTAEIGRIKRLTGLSVWDAEAERELRGIVLGECRRLGLDQRFALRLLALILSQSLQVQREVLRKDQISLAEIFAKARELERSGGDVIHLEVGEPDFGPPKPVVEEVKSAVSSGYIHYTEAAGITELREAIADLLNKNHGSDLKERNVIVTPGGRFAIFLAMAITIRPGDEVIVLEPSWPAYKECAEHFGGRAVTVQTQLEEGWSPPLDLIRELFTEATRMIALNYPNNPTGKILEDRTLREIVELAIEKGIFILSDEVYSDYAFKRFKSILEFPECRSVMVSSFSKSYGMTGFRVGYAVSDLRTIDRMARLQSLALTSVSEFVQRAALRALECAEDVKRNAMAVRRRWKALREVMKKLPFKFYEPEGGLYVFPRLESKGLDRANFPLRLLEEASVAVAPGTAFGDYPDHIRLSLCLREEFLLEGVRRMGKLLGSAPYEAKYSQESKD